MHTHSVCLIWFKAYTTVWLIPQTLSKKSPVIDLFCYVYFNKRLLFYLFHKVKNSSIGGGWAWNVTVNNNTDTHSLNNWLVGNTMDEHKLKLAELKESYTPEEWSCSSHMDWHSYKQVRLTDSQRRRVMGKGRFHYISAPARSQWDTALGPDSQHLHQHFWLWVTICSPDRPARKHTVTYLYTLKNKHILYAWDVCILIFGYAHTGLARRVCSASQQKGAMHFFWSWIFLGIFQPITHG